MTASVLLLSGALALAHGDARCFRVAGAGLREVNGLYHAEVLPGYAGPTAFRLRGTDLWLYRWHQTWWYLSKLEHPEGTESEADFTAPVIYSALVQDPDREHPPITGWTGDVMREYGPAPFPTVIPSDLCEDDVNTSADAHRAPPMETEVGDALSWRASIDPCLLLPIFLFGAALAAGIAECRMRHAKRRPRLVVIHSLPLAQTQSTITKLVLDKKAPIQTAELLPSGSAQATSAGAEKSV